MADRPLTPDEIDAQQMLLAAQNPAPAPVSTPQVPAALLHPDLGLAPKAGAPVATIPAPQISAADAGRMNEEDSASRAGLQVAAINAADHKKSSRAEAPASGIDFAPTPAEQHAAATAFALPPPHAVPAAELPVVDPKRQAQIQADLGLATSAEKQQGEAASGAALSEGVTQQKRADVLNRRADEALGRLDSNKADYRTELAKLQQLSDDAAKQGIDPDRLMKGKTAGQKFLMVLAAGLSGAAAGWNHQSGNTALEQQAREQAADIDAQKEGIAAKRQQVGDYRARLADLAREQTDDAAAVRDAYEAREKAAEAEGAAGGAGYRAQLVQAAGEEKAAMTEAAAQKELAAMNRYAPAHQAGGLGADQYKAILKRTMDLRDKGAAEGRDLSIDEARKQAAAEVLGQSGVEAQPYSKLPAEKTGTQIGLVAPGDVPTTTWFDPRRYFQGTDAFKNKLGQESWNADVLSAIHAQGVRDPDKAREIGAAFVVNPGDSQATIADKAALFNGYLARHAKGAAGATGAAMGGAPRAIPMKPIEADEGDE